MLVIGTMLLVAAMVALCVSLGIVQTTDGATRKRLVASNGRRARDKQERSFHFQGPEDAARLVVSRGMRARLERNLMLAGYPDGWTWQRILVLKAVAPVLVLFAMYRYSFTSLSLLHTGVGVAAVLVAYFLPDVLLHGRAVERQQKMELELPDALDKIVISIESGLGFDSALLRAAETGRGPFSEELTRTLQDIRLGMARRDAYEALAQRTRSDDVRRFVRSITQSEMTGVSVSTVVRNQSEEMRLKRKLRAEGKAQQVSVKLLFPLIVCVFPVLFVIVLAPGIITAIDTWQGSM